MKGSTAVGCFTISRGQTWRPRGRSGLFVGHLGLVHNRTSTILALRSSATSATGRRRTTTLLSQAAQGEVSASEVIHMNVRTHVDRGNTAFMEAVPRTPHRTLAQPQSAERRRRDAPGDHQRSACADRTTQPSPSATSLGPATNGAIVPVQHLQRWQRSSSHACDLASTLAPGRAAPSQQPATGRARAPSREAGSGQSIRRLPHDGGETTPRMPRTRPHLPTAP